MKKIYLSLFMFSCFFAATAHAADDKTYNVSAWLPSWDVEEANSSFINNYDVIDTISPFWYHVNEDGTLTPVKNSEDETIIQFAKNNGVPIVPTISNSFDGEKVSGFLNDPDEKEKNIQNIIDKVLEMEYDGIDIDYEGLKTEDIDVFTSYIADLDAALDKHNKKLTIAIQAKSYPTLAKFGNRGQDWAALAPYVDEFRIMTYDYGWRGSIPRPVAPDYWVEEVVEYAVNNVPREKIYIGVAFYGYGWSEDYFSSYTYDTINLILEKYGVDFQYDPRQRTNRLFYISEHDTREQVAPHEVWFENHISLEPKLELVKKYDLGGIAIWRLGKEDERNWRSIKKVLKNRDIGDPLFFKDVLPKTAYFKEITRLADLGIVKGHGGTVEFKPTDSVNRAEILKMALNSFAQDTSQYTFVETRGEDFQNPFKDVYEDQWYFTYVQTAADMGIAEGYPDGNFKPDQKIIRAEAVKLALESAGVDVGIVPGGENWYLPYKSWMLTHNVYQGADFIPGEEITRAEAAYIIAKVVEYIEETT